MSACAGARGTARIALVNDCERWRRSMTAHATTRPGHLTTTATLIGIAVAGLVGHAAADKAGDKPDKMAADHAAGAPAADKPAGDAPAAPVVRALTPYVEAHTHFEAGDPQGSVNAALAAIPRQNAAMVLLQ